MDAERRHELQENELAKDLGAAGEFIKNNLVSLIVGFLLVILVIAALVNWASVAKQNRQAEWSIYYQQSGNFAEPDTAGNELLKLASETGQRELAALAYVAGGEKLAFEANLKWLELPAESREKLLGRCEAAYNMVISKYSDQQAAAAKATLDLGRIAELRGDFAAASDLYKKTIEMPGSVGAVRIAAQKAMAMANNPPAEIMMAQKPVEPVEEVIEAEESPAAEQEEN